MADEVRRGLTGRQKTLPSKYFYDDVGSALFEEITELPEYYQTRTELAILQSIAPSLARDYGFADVVELGSGSSKKTLTLLDALERTGTLQRFVPFDVNAEMIHGAAATLLERYEQLTIHGVVGDFQRHLDRIPAPSGARLVIFLGSTIGNFDVAERRAFLTGVRPLLGMGDRFLLGVDLVKDVARLEAAYDDSAGVTAAFNRNILQVVNRELNADFAPERYRHEAFFNGEASRIEMHLRPSNTERVHIRALDLDFEVRSDETIWTEISCKYTRATAEVALEESGMRLERWYTDSDNLFGLALAAPGAMV